MCRLYVSYVRRVNDVITGGEKARGIVIQAFEFAVARVGIDINSSDLWLDYIEFLKFWTPAASWEQQQKVDLIRKVYKRCLSIPTEKIETMWSTYTKWENDINTATASKFIAEKSTSFMEARSWNTEWHNITQLLKREIIPFGITNDKDGIVSNQMKLWFNWIELEKENKLNLKEAASVRQRIEYVYKQSISALPFVPEIWFRFNKFLLSNNEEANLSNCIEQTEEALKLNDHSFLLSFQLSELYEKDNSFNQASTTLNNLIDVYIKDDNLVVEKIEKILEEKKINQVSNGDNEDMQESTSNGEKDNDDDDDDEEESVRNSQAQKILSRFTEEESDHLIELQEKHEELSKLITLIYTKLMIMSKRAEGMKESRTVFKQARKNYKGLGYQLFTEHALMEYYADRQKNADNIFKLAMKNYSTNGEFLLSYLNYLVLTNAVESIKVFFESAVTNLLKEITQEKESLNNTLDLYQTKSKTKNVEQNQYYMKKIIKKYVRFASNYLDIDTVKSLENRYEQFFPDDDPLELFADRYNSDSFDVISKYDLGKQVTSENVDPDLNRDSKRRKIESSLDNYTPEAESLPVHDDISQKPVEVNQHGFVGNTVYNLLQILPNAGYFGPPPEHVFNTGKLVELFSNLPDIPDNL